MRSRSSSENIPTLLFMEGYVERDKLKEEQSGVSFYTTRETGAIAKFFDEELAHVYARSRNDLEEGVRFFG